MSHGGGARYASSQKLTGNLATRVCVTLFGWFSGSVAQRGSFANSELAGYEEVENPVRDPLLHIEAQVSGQVQAQRCVVGYVAAGEELDAK